MTEAELATVCWVRAVEQGGGAGAVWNDEEAASASREALRRVGDGAERARATAFVIERARLAARRMAERDEAWRVPLQGDGPRGWRGLLLALAAVLAALIVGNVLGAARINLLAPPVLGLLAWNLVVYALLPFAAGRGPSAWLARAIEGARTRFSARGAALPLLAARARFVAEWTVATAGVQQARVAAAMHFAAALIALLVIASMYLFGLAFDYRAGWDSTWLDAEQVQRTLAFVFAPATALSGIEVPGIDSVAKLRFAEGSAGERAARWIHLYAITLALVVVLPRTALGAWAARNARRRTAQAALPLDEPYYRALLRDGPALPRPVTVLPYSYTLGAAQMKALPQALIAAFGPGAQAQIRPALPLGAEDALPPLDDAAADVAALFAATATPERETHGAFVQALGRALAQRAAVSVLVDESGFRARTGTASDAELRLTQRRAAWQRMLHDLALPAPRFIDLSA